MQIGYLGIGMMGEVLASNALAAGFDLMVYDPRPESLERLSARGAKVGSSAAEVGRHSEILQISIAGEERVEAALFDAGGAIEGLQPGSIISLHSTMGPATVQRIAHRASAHGVAVVDAPVTGGRPAAEAHTLCFIVGGTRENVERCTSLYEASGNQIFHMGDVGAGAGAKVAQQMMTVANIVGYSEGLRIATAAGIDRKQFLAMLECSTGRSDVSRVWEERYAGLAPEYIDGFYEGLRPALALAREVNVPVPLTALAQQLLHEAFRL